MGDLNKYVQGLEEHHMEDPRVQEYLASNFPSVFGSGEGNDMDQIYIDEETLAVTIGVPPSSSTSSSTSDDKGGTIEKDQSHNENKNKIDIMSRQCDLEKNIRPMISYKRDLETEEGSRQCQELRATTEMIPGILYGSDPTKDIKYNDPSSKILVKTPFRHIQRELNLYTYHNFESRVYDLTLFEDEDDMEGTVHRVLPTGVQYHPINQFKLYCCNFLRYHPGRPINIPIVYINEEESAALKRGGFIAPFNRHVSCIVQDGVKIPEAIEMDCTGIKLKDVLRRDRLLFPDGVEPSPKTKESFLIGTVFGRRTDGGNSDDGSAVAEAEESE